MNALFNVMSLRLKLIYRNPTIGMLTVVIVAIFSTLIGSLYAEVENSTKIRIGYVDESQSDFSEELITNLNNNELLISKEMTLKKGIKMVKKGEIEALFIIKEDVEDKVYSGDFDELIDLYFLSNNNLSPMVGDVFVGEMLEEISIITAVNYLEEALGEDRTNDIILEEAYNYGQELAKTRKENYYVTIEFISLETSESIKTEMVNNELLYKQMILGIILSFLSFFTLFTATSIVKDVETDLTKKLIISKTNKWKIVIGEYFSIVISSSIIAVILSSVSAFYSNKFLLNFLLITFVLIIYIGTFSALILFMTKQFHKVSSFIVMGAVVILIMGIMSGCFFSIDLTIPTIKKAAYFMPSYQALTQLMGIVVVGNIVNWSRYLIYTGIATTVLLLGTGLLWRTNKN